MIKPKATSEPHHFSRGSMSDKELLPLLNNRVKELGTNKRNYVSGLILKDLNVKVIPEKVIPAQYVIERDEESV